MERYTNKIVMISGAGDVALSIAQRVLLEDAKVVFTDFSEDALTNAVATMKAAGYDEESVMAVQCDMRSQAACGSSSGTTQTASPAAVSDSAEVNDTDLLRQMQNSDIDIVGCQIAPMVSFIPELAVFDLPMVFSKYDGDKIDQVLNGDSKTRSGLNAAYETANFHLLGILQNATYRLTTANVNLQSLSDFKRLQIRTMENRNHMAFWTAIEAEPTPLAWAEVYFALQSGTIDAQENAADTILGASLNDVQSYLACTNHILYANQLSISKSSWDALDPAYQAALDQAVNEAMEEMRGQLTEIDSKNKQLLTDAGMTLITYDEAFFDKILELDTIKVLYEEINESTNGLAAILQEELAK